MTAAMGYAFAGYGNPDHDHVPNTYEMQEKTMQDARDERPEPNAGSGEAGATSPRHGAATGEPARPESVHDAGDLGPGETRSFEFDADDEAQDGGHAHGLSPLVLGMLLGMLLLAGIAGWLVLQSRLDNLETQFTQLDERLQVVMGDTRRQGEALRGYLADPDGRRPVATPSGQEPAPQATEELSTLARQLATQAGRVAALEKRVANQDAALAEFDRRAERLEKRPLAETTEPRAPARPAPTAAPEVTPIEPSVGYVVVLASLPVREQALQELDRLRDKGLSVVLREAQIKNATWYRIQAEGFRDRDSATVFARNAEARHGVAGAWVVAP